MLWRRAIQAGRSAAQKGLGGGLTARGVSFHYKELVRDTERPVLSIMEIRSDWALDKEGEAEYRDRSRKQLQTALREDFPDSEEVLILKVDETVMDKGSTYPGHISTGVIDLKKAGLGVVEGTLMSKAGVDRDGGLARRTTETVTIDDGRTVTLSSYKIAARFHTGKEFLEGKLLVSTDSNPGLGTSLKHASKEYIIAIPMECLADVPISNLFEIWENCGLIPKGMPVLPLFHIFEESGVSVPEDAAFLPYKDFMKISRHIFMNGIKRADGSYLVEPRSIYDLSKDACTQAVATVHGVRLAKPTSTQLTAIAVLARLERAGDAAAYKITEAIRSATKVLEVDALELGRRYLEDKKADKSADKTGPAPSSGGPAPPSDGPAP